MAHLNPNLLLLATALALPLGGHAEEPKATPEPALKLSAPVLNHAHRRALGLVAADLNNDGKQDLAVVSNDESVLSLFLNSGDREADSPFEKQDVTLDRRVTSMIATDVNGDGRADLLLAGQPPSLAVYFQNEEGRLQKGPDNDVEAQFLVLGDLDGDGHDDVLVTNGREFQVLRRSGDALDLEPAMTFFSTGEPTKAPQLLDLDGDGRLDIAFTPSDDASSVVVRLQDSKGAFPAEFRVRTGQLRDIAAMPNGDDGSLLAAVHGQTRDLLLLQLADAVEPPAGRLALSAPRLIGFDPESRDENTSMTVADVNGDGRHDLLITTPSRASLRLLLQTEDGSFVPRETPSFQDLRQVLAWPAGDGEPQQLLFLSGDEKTIGVAGIDPASGTDLSFPRPLPLAQQPTRVALARVAGQDKPALVAAETGPDKELRLRLYPAFTPDGAGEPTEVLDLAAHGKNVTGLSAIDMDRDGLDDLVVFHEFSDPLVLMQREGGAFERLDTTGLLGGILKGASERLLSSASLAPGASPEVLVVKENFVRAFHLGEGGELLVSEQFNATGARPRLRAVAVADMTEGDAYEVAVLDGSSNSVTVHGVRDGAYTSLRTVQLEEAAYRGLAAMDLDGDGRDDLVALAPDRVAIVYSRVLNGGLETIESVQSEIDDGGYGAVYPLALGEQGEVLLGVVEMESNQLEFHGRERGALARVFGFRVFDIESMMRRRQNLDRPAEPREALARDLDGDGAADLAILVHDKVIVYFQSP